jgi:tetratricopeptide (TPR) repeat protein
VPFPDSLQALIAARLDTLTPDLKGLLQDAAVVGKVFWAGAVVAMGNRPEDEVGRALHALARKEFVRPFRRSSMEGDSEFGFWHALVRDVAYGQIPRGERAGKHARAVDWLERMAGDRVEDLAEVLAFHTGEAIGLAEATGDAELAAELGPAGRRYALLAGERALGLDIANALRLLERALEVTPEDDPAFPSILVVWSRAAFPSGDLAGAADALERAVRLFRDRGDVESAAVALGELSIVHSYQSDPRAPAEAEEAVALLEGRTGEALVAALTTLAGSNLVNGDYERCRIAAARALELASEHGLPVPLRALGFHGGARVNLGDADGLEELRRARDLVVAGGGGREAVVLANNYATALEDVEGLVVGVPAFEEVIALATARGVTTAVLRADHLSQLVDVGRLDEVVADGRRVYEECRAQGFAGRAVGGAAATARALHETGSTRHALVLAQATCEQLTDAIHQPELAVRSAGDLVGILTASGRHDDARSLLEWLVSDARWLRSSGHRLAALVRGAVSVGDVRLAARLLDGASPNWPTSEADLAAARAHLVEARGETHAAAEQYAQVAERLRALGARLEEAYAVLGHGRCLVALGDPDAEPTLRRARQLFASMGAQSRVDECDTLLAQVRRLSS